MKYELRLNGQPNESSRQLECILWWNEAVKCQDSNCKKHFKQANWSLLLERLWLHAIRLWFARKSLVRFLFELITNRWATFQLSIACDCNCSSSKWSFEIFFRGLNPPNQGEPLVQRSIIICRYLKSHIIPCDWFVHLCHTGVYYSSLEELVAIRCQAHHVRHDLCGNIWPKPHWIGLIQHCE